MNAASLIPPQYKAAAIAACAVALFAAGAWSGFALRSNIAEAAEGRRLSAEATAYGQAVEDMNKVATDVAAAITAARDQVRVVQVQVQKETERVEYRCPVPQSGVDLYNRAARGLRVEPDR
jgi:hypothetical protein